MSHLKEKRTVMGLSQSQLAEKSGVSKRAIQDYEQGYRDINGAKAIYIYKLAQALECNMEDLIHIE